jgi:hypothetical protein
MYVIETAIHMTIDDKQTRFECHSVVLFMLFFEAAKLANVRRSTSLQLRIVVVEHQVEIPGINWKFQVYVSRFMREYIGGAAKVLLLFLVVQ